MPNSKKGKFMRLYPGPYTCHFCGDPITELYGRGGSALNVHHVDGNGRNDEPGNMVAVHRRCHSRYHNTRIDRDLKLSFHFEHEYLDVPSVDELE